VVTVRRWRIEFTDGTKDGRVSIIYKMMKQLKMEKLPPTRIKGMGTLKVCLAVPFKNVDTLNQTGSNIPSMGESDRRDQMSHSNSTEKEGRK
jgi:hypothetical protein